MEIIKRFTDKMGETITESWAANGVFYAHTDEYTYACYENGRLDTFDGNLTVEEVTNGTPGTSYDYSDGEFVERH